MTSVSSDFLCGRPQALTVPVHRRPPEPLPPPCGRHKWMAPYLSIRYQSIACVLHFTVAEWKTEKVKLHLKK